VRLAGAGQRVAVVERRYLGGTCVNVGCKPTKTLIASAHAAHLARRGADFGIVTGPVRVDMPAVKARVDRMVLESRQGLADWLTGTEGCTLIEGHARFVGPRAVAVGERRLEAERIFINVGARAAVPALPGIERVATLTNSSLLALDVLPRHLVVVGGGPIGLEFAQAYRRFGAEVTVVEKGPRLAGREDEDVSEALRGILEAEGIVVRTGAECIRFAPHADGIMVGVDCESGVPEEIGSHVLLAMGRQPNTDDLGLDAAGVETDGRGYVTVDETLATNVPGVWALGECNGRGAFTHTAYNDFEIVAANLLDGGSRRVGDRRPAYALFTDPPLGRAGMSEAEARASGRRVLVGTRPMTRVSRAVEKGETAGFMKVLADADTREILGAAILGTGGDEAVHAVLDLMYAGAPVETALRAVHIHPTVSELLPTVFGELRPLA
jgi:pyruvate/2-oxoglutarate dehydrogenase complex dihydrolipoamide dehydrogenase (E3) component